MKPIRSNTANRTYTGEGCIPLPATAIQYSDGKIGTETCFELTDDELEQIKKSKRIYVTFAGQTIIPFMVHTETHTAVKAEPL
ncbi:MAG: hypothetical protein K0R31_2143 [Clostridiales bacterium]|jgi:hypothetical protein|nr:hypothetical protein [Clostridiales bacterium]